MADKNYKINIETTADSTGADKIKEALYNVEDTLRELENEGLDLGYEKQIQNVREMRNGILGLLELTGEGFTNGSPAADEYREKLQEVFEAMERVHGSVKQLAPSLDDASDAFKKNLKKSNEELDKLDKKADKANKSLKKIEILQTAEALGRMVKQSQSAGEGFANLGEDGNSLTDDLMGATQAAGELAGSMTSAYAVLGPIGLALAAASAAIGYFTAQNEKLAKEIKGSFSEIDTTFKQTQESIDNAAARVAHYREEYVQLNAVLDNTTRRIQSTIDIELKRQEISARIADDQIRIRELKIIGNDDLSASEKAKQLGEIEKEKLEASFKRREERLKAELAKSQSELNQIVSKQGNASDRLDEARSRASTAPDAKESKEYLEQTKEDFNETVRGATEKLSQTIELFGAFQEERGLIERKLKNLGSGESVEGNARVAQELVSALTGKGSDLSSKDEDAINSLENIIILAERVKNQEAETQDEVSRANAAQKELTDAQNDYASIMKSYGAETAQRLLEEKKLRLELESLSSEKSSKGEILNLRTDNKVRTALKQERKATDAEAKKAESAQSQIDNNVTQVAEKAIGVAGGIGNQPEVNRLTNVLESFRDGASKEEVLLLRKIIGSMESFVDNQQQQKAELTSELSKQASKLDSLETQIRNKK